MAGGSYELKFHRRALERLAAIEPKKVQSQVTERAMALADNPLPPGVIPLAGVKLDGQAVYRIKSGDYRIIFVVGTDPKVVTVLHIRNRKEGYKRI